VFVFIVGVATCRPQNKGELYPMKDYTFKQFLLTLGLIILTIGVLFSVLLWFGNANILNTLFLILQIMFVTGPIACIFIALSRILGHLEKAESSNKRTEERLERIIRKMEEAEKKEE